MDGRRRLMGNGVEMVSVHISLTADKNPPSSTTIDVNGVTYNINFGSANGITVQVPKWQPCTITPSAIPDYITPNPINFTPGYYPSVSPTFSVTYKMDLVWVPIYIISLGTPSSSSRPCFGYLYKATNSSYGEMTTLKNLGSVIYGIRGTSKYTTRTTASIAERPSVVLSNNAKISYYILSGSGSTFKYAYIYNKNGTKITSETDGYWTLTFSRPVSITELNGGRTEIDKGLSWIQVTRSTYAAVTGLDYPTT